MRPVADAEESDASENLALSPTSKKRRSDLFRQPTGAGNAATADVKLASPPSQSTSPKSLSEAAELPHAATNKRLEQIDSCSFSPSPRSLKSNSSPNSSPQSAAAEDVTSADGSMSAAASPESHQPLPVPSPRAAVQALQDSTNAARVKFPVKIQSATVEQPLVADESPRSGVSSRRSSPGGVVRDQHDSVLSRDHSMNERQLSSALPAPLSDVGSPSPCRSDPGRSSTHSSGGRLQGNIASDPSGSSSKKNVGRGRLIMEILKCPAAAAEVGARADADAESQRSYKPGTVLHTTDGPPCKYFEQLPEQMPVLSSGLNEDFGSCVSQVKQPFPEGGDSEAVRQVVGEKASPASRSGNPDVTAGATAARGVVMNITQDSCIFSPKTEPEPSTRSTPSPVPNLRENFSVPEMASRTSTPTMQQHQTGPVDRSFGSSSDVSLSGEVLDQSSSSRMLTKRLPRVASRSGSRTGTPVPPSAQTAVPGRLSYSSSPVLAATASHAASLTGANESYDCIPEVSRETFTRHSAVPPISRFLCNLLSMVFRSTLRQSPLNEASLKCPSVRPCVMRMSVYPQKLSLISMKVGM